MTVVLTIYPSPITITTTLVEIFLFLTIRS